MAGGRSAPGGDRGGGAIPTTVPDRARVALPIAALALAVGVAVWPALAGAGEPRVTLLLGAIGLVIFAIGVAMRWAALVAPGLAFFGAGYAASLGSAIDGGAPLYACLLVLTGEVAYWALDLRVPIPTEAGTQRVRAIVVAVTVLTSVILATAIVALTALPPLPGGTALEAVGIMAAAGALALAVVLARPRELQRVDRSVQTDARS